MCVALLWTLPTPQTILIIGYAWNMFRPVSNCESRRLPFSGFRFGVEMQKLEEVEVKIVSLNDYIKILSNF